MIDVKELRIGNYIHGIYTDEDINGEEFELTTFSEVVALDQVDLTDHSIWVDSDANKETYDDFRGITPTEQWFLDFGFETDKICYWYEFSIDGQVGYVAIGHYKDGFYFLPTNHITIRTIKIKSVHQIQNLTFALTGTELTRK